MIKMRETTNLAILCMLILLISCKKENEDLLFLTSDELLSTCSESIDEMCIDEENCDVFAVIEEMPRFNNEECEEIVDRRERIDCANEKLAEYLSENVNYPEIARENKIEGTVTIRVLVRDTLGCLSNIEIVQDIGYGCGIEVQRVVSTMPNFVIGKQRGVPLNVRYFINYEFKL